MKQIILKYGVITKVAKEAGCSRNHAQMCLRGAVDSPLAKEVRRIAFAMGGVEESPIKKTVKKANI